MALNNVVAMAPASSGRETSSKKEHADRFVPNKNFIKVMTPFMVDRKAQYSGYDICKITGLRTGVVYPLLKSLQEKGWLSGEWEGDKRCLYKITLDGLNNGRKVIDIEYPHLRAAIMATD